jgi:hypothetical protein
MACIFLFLSPRVVSLLEKIQFHFEIFFQFIYKALGLSLSLKLNIEINSQTFQM